MEFPNIVACGNCGEVQKSQIQMRGSYQNITLRNCLQRCRLCGEMFALPEGVFTSVQNTTRLLARSDNDLSKIDALKSALERVARNPQDDIADFAASLEQAGIQPAQEIANSAPKNAKEKGLWAAAIGSAITYAWTEIPQGALSWIELFTKINEAWNQ